MYNYFLAQKLMVQTNIPWTWNGTYFEPLYTYYEDYLGVDSEAMKNMGGYWVGVEPTPTPAIGELLVD